MLSPGDPPQNKRSIETESEELEENIPSKGKGKQTGVAIFISDKNRLQKQSIKTDTEGYFIILKERFHQEDINIINICAPNIGAQKYIRKILHDFKGDIDNNTLTKGF